jgi:signal transduction histidine kinase/CheY-like chemotaxis protein
MWNVLSHLSRIIPQASSANNDNVNHKPVKQMVTIRDTVDKRELATYIKCVFHELRTPLNNISIGLDILKSQEDGKEEVCEILEHMKNSCLFMNETLNGFLTINENKDEPIRIKYEPFNIVGLIKKVENLVHFNILQKNIDIIYQIDPDIYEWVIGDSSKIEHVLLNLLSNAIKYSDETTHTNTVLQSEGIPNFMQMISSQFDASRHIISGYPIGESNPADVKKNICLSIRKKDFKNKKQHIEFVITDENHHIPKYIKTHLFHKKNNLQGIGLGLYLAHNIIDLHGGHLRHEYGIPMGNKFIIDLTFDICSKSSNDDLRINAGGESTNKSVNSSPINKISLQLNRKMSMLNEWINPSGNISELSLNTLVKQSDTVSEKSNMYLIVDDSELSRKLLHKLLKIKKKEVDFEENATCDNSDLVKDDVYEKRGVSNDYNSNDTSAIPKKPSSSSLDNENTKLKIVECVDGVDVINKIQYNMDEIDIIFMDNIMPNITGTFATKIIRSLGFNNLIIGITGNGTGDDIIEFYENGADYVYIKPFSKQKLDILFAFIKKNGFKRRLGKRIQETKDNQLEWS